MSANDLKINFVQGKMAPKYTDVPTIELQCERCVITEQATVKNLPIVDFVLKDKNGNQYLFVLTGRIVNTVSAAIKGTNVRNHGIEEP